MKQKAIILIIAMLLIFTTGCSSSGRIIKEIDCGVFIKKDADGYFIDASESFEKFYEEKRNEICYTINIEFYDLFDFAYSMKTQNFGWRFIYECEKLVGRGSTIRLVDLDDEFMPTYKNQFVVKNIINYQSNFHDFYNEVDEIIFTSRIKNKGYINNHKEIGLYPIYERHYKNIETIKNEKIEHKDLGVTEINYQYKLNEKVIKNDNFYEFTNGDYKYLISYIYDEETNEKKYGDIVVENSDCAIVISTHIDDMELSELKAFVSNFGIGDYDWDKFMKDEIEKMLSPSENSEEVKWEAFEKIRIGQSSELVKKFIGNPKKVEIGDEIYAYYDYETGNEIKLKYYVSHTYDEGCKLYLGEIIK